METELSLVQDQSPLKVRLIAYPSAMAVAPFGGLGPAGRLYARFGGVLGPNSTNFMPHGYCYMWDPRIVWLHVITDALIGLSYYAIPCHPGLFHSQAPESPFQLDFLDVRRLHSGVWHDSFDGNLEHLAR